MIAFTTQMLIGSTMWPRWHAQIQQLATLIGVDLPRRFTLELLEVIVENDDFQNYGSIVSVQTGRDD